MISKHFSREEFKCKCGECEQDTVDVELVSILEAVREWAGAAVLINSANRCPAYNLKIGGSIRSQHLLSRAADIRVKGKTPEEVYTFINTTYPNRYGLGSYSTFTHVDSRSGKARWYK